PEQDRFAKGEHNQPGNVLLVELDGCGSIPQVERIATTAIEWLEPDPIRFNGDEDLRGFEQDLADWSGTRTGRNLLKLNLSGVLSYAGLSRLEQILESLKARTLELRLE
ncbi:hypothetical protein RZS08_03685, partial [Arthrospira platensis SPKY1]|nr:hypothetical protein [Arthrospira platensis SPKY1]